MGRWRPPGPKSSPYNTAEGIEFLQQEHVGWGEERTPTETPIFIEMLGFAELTPTYGFF